MSYLDVQYGYARQPKSDFPAQLIAMLHDRVGLCRTGNVVLDVGAGRGDFAYAWAHGFPLGQDDQLYTVYTLDQEGLSDIKVDLRHAWPVHGDSIDVVFSKSTIEHLSDPTMMVNEIKRVMKPGATLILMTPDWRTYMRTFWDDYTHRQPYDQVSLGDLLAAHGFVDIKVELLYQYPLAWRHQSLRAMFTLWRWVIPLEMSLWICRMTGWTWPKWASQLTVLAMARKPWT